MQKNVFVLLGIALVLGCARVSVQAPKDPIKLDVSMRLDIYQHIQKDIDSIEDMVSGGAQKPASPAAKDKHGLLNLVIGTAYAEDLSPEVEAAAARRRDRRPQLSGWEAKGVVGENRSGLVEMKGADLNAQSLVQEENSDRMVIYQVVAEKNGSSIDAVQDLYAKRLQDDAPAGTPIEGPSGWRNKQ